MAGGSSRRTHADRVFDVLQAQGQPLSAYQILEALRPDGVNAATTVYRALDQLHGAGRVHRIESLNAWTVCCAPRHAEPPVFEICTDCGAVTERLDNRLARDVAALSDRTGFAPDTSVIEIRGRCTRCRGGAATPCPTPCPTL